MENQNYIKIDKEAQRHLNAYIDYQMNAGAGDAPFTPEVNPLVPYQKLLNVFCLILAANINPSIFKKSLFCSPQSIRNTRSLRRSKETTLKIGYLSLGSIAKEEFVKI